MELIPFLKKEDKIPLIHCVIISLPKKAQIKIIKYMFVEDKKLSQKKNDAIKEREEDIKLSILKQQKVYLLRLEDFLGETKLAVDNIKYVSRGAAAGGCCGIMGGMSVGGLYECIVGTAWCCSSVLLPQKIMWDIMSVSVPTCGCIGCMTGMCCVMTGYSKKIGCI
jgi:hypothetical protein